MENCRRHTKILNKWNSSCYNVSLISSALTKMQLLIDEILQKTNNKIDTQKTGECNHTHHICQPSTLLYCLIRTLKLLCLGQPATTNEGIIID